MPGLRTIAVVDDDEDIRDALTEMFASRGMLAVSFANASDFLAYPELSDNPCLVSDIHMPDMNGIELVRTLQMRKFAGPIILISAFATDVVRKQAKGLGVLDVFEKPFNPEALLERVEQALRA